jgi:pyruvate kinase
MTQLAAGLAADLGLAPANGRVWILAGTPFGSPGAANLLRLAHAPALTRG